MLGHDGQGVPNQGIAATIPRGRSLWEVLYEHVQQKGPISREQVLVRFFADDPLSVRGVLKDLVDTGLVYRTGRGDSSRYQATSDSEPVSSIEAVDQLVWLSVHRLGPITAGGLSHTLSLDAHLVAQATERLVQAGSIRRHPTEADAFESDGCVMALDDPKGWETAVFDHYQAMVTALCTKLRLGKTRARAADWVGGSTFSFRVWPGHDHYDEARSVLAQFRARGSELRHKIAAYNRTHPEPEDGSVKVVVYAGQTVIGPEETREYDDEE